MPSDLKDSTPFRVVIVGGGVAALETALALADLAPERIEATVVAPNGEFVYRPMVIREPFGLGAARRYELAPIVEDTGARLLNDQLGSIDRVGQTILTKNGETIPYDALVLALGASVSKRYEHALTIDDRDLDKTMHGLIQDVEGGYTKKLAFIAGGRMAWPLPLYEFALLTMARAYDMGAELEATIVTPEDSPLAIFGASASGSVAALLERANIRMITSAYSEVPNAHELVISPGDRRLKVDRVIALPELFGPAVHGIPLGEHGFVRVDSYCRVPDVENIYAAGDATDFPIKHGGIAAQQADVVAKSIAALAGAPVTPERFKPTIQGMLLTGEKPVYLSARLTGGQGFSSEITDTPPSPRDKIAARYLAPYLERLDREETRPADPVALLP
jgi:sulfide:quinone oxidoreductase